MGQNCQKENALPLRYMLLDCELQDAKPWICFLFCLQCLAHNGHQRFLEEELMAMAA